jgi:hypothetical protein
MASKEWFGLDGFNHGIYSLLVMCATGFFTFLFFSIVWITVALGIAWGILTVVWFGFEYTQEKAMGRGLEKKPLRWSISRFKDMGWPQFFCSVVFLSWVYFSRDYVNAIITG